MTQHRIFKTPFAKIYPMYVQKAERKGRTKDEVDEVIRWLTGYSQAQLQQQIDTGNDLETFFAQASMNPRSELIKGVVCGIRVEDVDDRRTEPPSGAICIDGPAPPGTRRCAGSA